MTIPLSAQLVSPAAPFLADPGPHPRVFSGPIASSLIPSASSLVPSASTRLFSPYLLLNPHHRLPASRWCPPSYTISTHRGRPGHLRSSRPSRSGSTCASDQPRSSSSAPGQPRSSSSALGQPQSSSSALGQPQSSASSSALGQPQSSSSSSALDHPSLIHPDHSRLTPSDKISSFSFSRPRHPAEPPQSPLSSTHPPHHHHLHAASIGPARSSNVLPQDHHPPLSTQSAALDSSDSSFRLQSAARRFHQLSLQNLSHVPDDFSDDDDDHHHHHHHTAPLDLQSPPVNSSDHPDAAPANPHPVVRVSKRTHSAILYALEEALRYPNTFSPDLVEESAHMADLAPATAGPITSSYTRQSDPASTTTALPRPTTAPAPTASPSGIRGPRMIMMERAAREARQRDEAERQRIQQARADQEARQMQEMRRRSSARPTTAVADRQTANPSHHRTRSHPGPQSSQQPSHVSMPQHHYQHQQSPSQAYLAQGSAAQQRRSSEPPPAELIAPTTESAKPPRNSFPHAFERWETLSAHWEGLTSYWIRKLEQHKDEVNRDSLSQQLARQVTDLSAAGANLFHAVVELQRLRASSERKFQRWFFETRTELERSREVNALLEKALEKERHERSDAIRDAVENERGVSKTQKQLAEMRKELSISKEEARRAWEELGRREQEERDRTLSLQSGHPTLVGGVQVVPMTQSHPPRQTTSSSRDPPASSGAQHAAETSHTLSEHPPRPASGSSGGHHGPIQGSGGSRRDDSAAATAAAMPETDYRMGDYVLDAKGEAVLDVHGNRIPYMAPPSTYSGSEQEAEEYETPTTTNPPTSGGQEPITAASTTSAGAGGGGGGSSGNSQWTGAYSHSQDYSGDGYGTPGWESVQRHHHPTRLSDVIEEDERSRASTGQISRA